MTTEELAPELRQRDVALVDLLDRLLAGGVVIAGEITLSIADIDLVRISLRALIASVSSLADPGGSDGGAAL
ncbi:gas vesicle protein [Kitasatospora sp. NPDC004272]